MKANFCKQEVLEISRKNIKKSNSNIAMIVCYDTCNIQRLVFQQSVWIAHRAAWFASKLQLHRCSRHVERQIVVLFCRCNRQWWTAARDRRNWNFRLCITIFRRSTWVQREQSPRKKM